MLGFGVACHKPPDEPARGDCRTREDARVGAIANPRADARAVLRSKLAGQTVLSHWRAIAFALSSAMNPVTAPAAASAPSAPKAIQGAK